MIPYQARCTLLILAAATVSFAQDSQNPQPVKQRPAEKRRPVDEQIEIPLPLVSPRAIQPGTLNPLSSKQKAGLAFRNTFYPRPLANRVLLAGIDSLNNDLREWPSGAEGFGMRLGNRMGSLATRNAIQLGFDVLFHTEPRYDICTCKGIRPRTWHALKRSFTQLSDNGNEVISASRLAGSLATPWVTREWQPDRVNTTGRKFDSGAVNVGMRGVTNLVREFWPDLSRKLRLPARLRRQDTQN